MCRKFAFVLLLAIIFLLQCVHNSRCAEPIWSEWNRTYGGVNRDDAYSIIETSDGGFMLCGRTCNRYVPDSSNAMLVKINSAGNVEWERTYGGSGFPPYETHDDEAYDVVEATDGGYAFVGYTRQWKYPFGTQMDCWLVKVNSTGGEQWQKKFRYASGVDEAFESIIATPDGGFAIAGSVFIKTDANGNQLWKKSYGVLLRSVIQTKDGGYALASEYWTQNYYRDFWLGKTDASGNLVFNKTYGGVSHRDESAYSVIQTEDGGYALAGYIGNNAWLVRVDSSGNMLLNRTYGGTRQCLFRSIVETADLGYVLTGYVGNALDPTDEDFWLVRVDSSGNLLWDSTYVGVKADVAYEGIVTSDGSYALVGLTYSYGAGDADFWLVKVEPTRKPYRIKVDDQDYFVFIDSNSTIRGFDFDLWLKQMSFNTSGPQSETSWCNVTIPSDLLWGDFLMLMDGDLLVENVDYVKTSNDTHVALYFTYINSGHTIEIIGTNVVPEFPSFLILPLFMVGTGLAIVLARRKISRKPKT